MASNYNNRPTVTSKQPQPILKSKMVHPNLSSSSTASQPNNNNPTLRNSTGSSKTSSRKRTHSSSMVVEFSQEIKIMERKATMESEEVFESDTDVGSQIDDSFDLDDSFDNDKNDDLDAILTNKNITKKKKESSLSPHKTSQMAAKVRRLNLNSDDIDNNTNGSSYSNGSMDVKRAMEIARQSFLDKGGDSDDNERAVTKVTSSNSGSKKKRIGYAPKHTTARRSSPGNNGGSGGGGGGVGLFGSNNYSSGGGEEKKMSATRVSNESSSSDMASPCIRYGPPPSTIKKKKGRSRLFHNDTDDDMDMNRDGMSMNIETKFKLDGDEMNDDDKEEDVSPLDALDFPFFNNNNTASSSPKKASQKENSNLTSDATNKEKDGHGVSSNNKSYEAMTSSSSINTNYQSLNSPPRFQAPSSSNHPSTAKRSNQSRVVDRGDMFDPQPDNINLLNSTASSSTNNSGIVERPSIPQRPMGLRSVGRANSFLQMFSQGSIDSSGNDCSSSMRSIDEDQGGQDRGQGVNLKFGYDDDEDDFMLHTTNNRPKSHQRNDSILSVGATIHTSDMITCPSPQRPMRKANKSRYTPASPVNSGDTNNNNAFSRFVNDFEIIGTLGNGSFGSVYSVRNRTDQRLYAIKAAKREAQNSTDRNRMLQEVYALSVLSDKACMSSMHIVRYHQAWMEGNRLYIQTELCETTLLHEMKNNDVGGKSILLDEKRRYKLLREMLLALDLVHKSNMIHLDIKPENIFIKNNQYKLGDFGLVGKTEGKHDDVEEGDSRYMSPELLSGELDDLTKSDIFSLGATMYEISLGLNPQEPKSLPENGQEWQDIRHGILLPMPSTAFDLQMIVREMMSPEWRSRPSAEVLLKKRQLLSDDEREIMGLNMALDAQMQRFKQLSPKTGPGTKFKRSNTFC